jgi:molecular chaperone DnaK (HSP70)
MTDEPKPTMKQQSESASEEPTRPRYVIGIDLGTTNSAVSYVDTEI